MVLSCYDSTGKKVSDDICIQKNAPMPSHKECAAGQICTISSTGEPEYYRLGCYKDNRSNRRVPQYIKNLRSSIDWSNMEPTIKACAKLASAKPYTYFAIQFYGECWGGEASAATTYYIDGPSDNCYAGTGGHDTNYVYHLGRRTELPPVLPLGCYNGTFTTLVKDFSKDFDWTKPLTAADSTKVVSKCAIAAANSGFTTFGLKHPGQCWSGPMAQVTYNKGGAVKACDTELGGSQAYSVYRFFSQPK